jgi:succinate dehydrogenase/fumarate reductase flavoprotein subunit
MGWARNDGADERLREIQRGFNRIHDRLNRRVLRSLRAQLTVRNGIALVVLIVVGVLAVIAFRGDEVRDDLPNLASAKPAVFDGDTVRWEGRTVRLVGFDTPETGNRARCHSANTRCIFVPMRSAAH